MKGMCTLSIVLLGGYSLTAMDGQGDTAVQALAQVLQQNLRASRPKTETGIESFSVELQALVGKHLQLEKEKQKALESIARPAVEPPSDFNFEHYALNFDHMAGSISREVREIIDVLKNTERFTRVGLRELPLGLLLHGPSGTGKTLLAKLIASQTGRVMAHEYSSSFITNFQGSGVERIKRLFDQARALNKPVIIFIDEIDGLANSELKGSEGEATRAVHEIHKQMGVMGPQVFVIMATNNYDKIPSSIKDRFANTTLLVGLPDLATRFALLKQLCLSARLQLSDQFFYKLATETEGLSCRVLENVVTKALISAGQRLPDVAIATGDFYLAAYTTQKMKLPNGARRLKLIKYYFGGKNVSADVDDECTALCMQETEGWDAQKIERWANLAEGLSIAKGCNRIGREHMLIALCLIDSHKVPHALRRKLVLMHFLGQRVVRDLPACIDFLIEETEGIATEGLQAMVELAVDIKKQRKEHELIKEHFLVACTLAFKKPLTHYKRVALLHHYLAEKSCGGVSRDFLHELALQMHQASVDDVKNIVEKALDISRLRALLAPDLEDFYVAVCLNQKNEPVRKKEYRIALVKYYLRHCIAHDFTQQYFTELIDILKDQSPAKVELVIKGAESWARKRHLQIITPIDISLALYEHCFESFADLISLREICVRFLLEGRCLINAVGLQKLVHGTRGLPLHRIVRVLEYAQETAQGMINQEHAYIGLFFELKSDEKETAVRRGWYTIQEKIPFGDSSRLPDEFQAMALLNYYLNKKYHFICDAFKTYFIQAAQGVSRYGIERIVEAAYVQASIHGFKHNGEVHIREMHMIQAIGEVYPHIGFWPWRIQSFGKVRDAHHRGCHIKEL